MTDANLMLGRIAAGARLAGTMELGTAEARAALTRIGGSIGFSPARTALGMLEVVEAHMQRAIRRVSVEEGADPRCAALVAFGGAGGLHATALARSLGMAGVIVPAHAGVFSAVGLLLAPPRADAARSVLIRDADRRLLDPAVREIAAAGTEGLRQAGVAAIPAVDTRVDVRYLGQAHETTVRYEVGEGWDALSERFHEAHRERNGFARPDDPIEVVTVRAEATGRAALRWSDLPEHAPRGDSRLGDRPILTGSGEVQAAGWWRPGLRPGSSVEGPAVIEEPEATTYLAPGERARLHPSGALEIEW